MPGQAPLIFKLLKRGLWGGDKAERAQPNELGQPEKNFLSPDYSTWKKKGARGLPPPKPHSLF